MISEQPSDFAVSLKVGDTAYHKYYQRNVTITLIEYNATSQTNLQFSFEGANPDALYWDSFWFLPPNNGDAGNIIDNYFQSQHMIYEYFGYVEGYKILPLQDYRNYYWHLLRDSVLYAESTDVLGTDDHYESKIYRTRHLDRHVIVTSEYTLISIDSHLDGNKYLSIFDNSKNVPTVEGK